MKNSIKLFTAVFCGLFCLASSHLQAQDEVKKKRSYVEPAVYFISSKEANKYYFMLNQAVDCKCVVFDRATKSFKSYSVNERLAVVEDLPADGYVSFEREEGNTVTTYGSLEIKDITNSPFNSFKSVYAKGTKKSAEEVAATLGGQSTNGVSSRNPKGSKLPIDNDAMPSGKDEEVKEVKEEVIVEKEPVQEEPKKEEPVKEVERTYTKAEAKKTIEEFILANDIKHAAINKEFAISSIEQSKIKESKKAKLKAKVESAYADDLSVINSAKGAKDRQKTVDQLFEKDGYTLKTVKESYVVLTKDNQEWIFDEHHFLHNSADIEIESGLKIDPAFVVSKKDNNITLTNAKLSCPIVITKKPENKLEMQYGKTYIGDFMTGSSKKDKKSSKQYYEIAIEVNNANEVLIKSAKETNSIILTEEVATLSARDKKGKEKNSEKIAVKPCAK
jgi:hypothetical protein